MIACTWDHPGADRYMGDVPAAIAAYLFQPATQAALIDAFERRDFTDTVVIDRNSIRGKAHEYDPDIRAMHFGASGRTCDTVTRTGWKPEHAETALVICAGAECIAIPAVCTNVFRLTRREAFKPTEHAEPFGLPLGPLAEPAVLVLGLPGGSAFAISRADGYGGDYAPASTFAAPSYGGGGWGGYAPFCESCRPVPVAAVAEPSPYLLILLGLVAVAVWRRA